MLFKILTHRSSIPFTHYAEDPKISPGSLDYEGLLHSVVLGIYRKTRLNVGSYVNTLWVISRSHSLVDNLRQTFQALASPHIRLEPSRLLDSQVYPGSEQSTHEYWVDVSVETVEMIDLLDIPSASQPGFRGQHVPRNWYKPIEKTLVKSEKSMRDLRVERADFHALLKLVLAWPSSKNSHYIKIENTTDLEKLDTEAARILRDFLSEPESSSID